MPDFLSSRMRTKDRSSPMQSPPAVPSSFVRKQTHPTSTRATPKVTKDASPFIVLSELEEPPSLSATAVIRPATCSACGDFSPSLPALSEKSNGWVQCVPCGHLMCPGCLFEFINAVSNDPPRSNGCFTCLESVETFEGVAFARDESIDEDTPRTPERQEGQKKTWIEGGSPVKNGFIPNLSGTPMTFGSEWSIPPPVAYPVVRVDNVAWNVSVSDVEAWIPATVEKIPSSEQPLFIHILCNRHDGRTLNQLFIELPSSQAAQQLLKLTRGRKLCDRPVSAVLSSQTELLQHIFASWPYGFEGVEAKEPEREGDLITVDELEGLAILCSRVLRLNKRKPSERPFLQLVTILEKMPWHQLEMWTHKLVARLFKVVQDALVHLLKLVVAFANEDEHRKVCDTLITAATGCPAFRPAQKEKLLVLAGLGSPTFSTTGTLFSPPSSNSSAASSTSPTSSGSGKTPLPLRSPTLDRVKNTDELPQPLPLLFRWAPTPPPSPSSGRMRVDILPRMMSVRRAFVPASPVKEADEQGRGTAEDSSEGEEIEMEVF